MTLHQLKYVSMVEKCGSFSRAAQKLYVSQPSISNLVNALEEELGITIFTRSSTGIAITNEGLINRTYRLEIAEKGLTRVSDAGVPVEVAIEWSDRDRVLDFLTDTFCES